MIEFDYLSFGAGTQSTALLCLFKEEKIKFKKAIFADTGAEPEFVYEHLELLKNKFPNLIETCKYKRDIVSDTFHYKYVTAPVYGSKKEKPIQGRRVCTSRFKIYPVANKMRELENKVRRRLPENSISMGLGFSTDESGRAKDNQMRWIKNVFPLLELKLSRNDCKSIIKRHGLEPIRSACYFCPFMNDKEWQHLKDNYPKDFKKAVNYDHKIRDLKEGNKNYLHRSMKPLDQIDFKKEDDQPNLFAFNECESGYCGT